MLIGLVIVVIGTLPLALTRIASAKIFSTEMLVRKTDSVASQVEWEELGDTVR